MEYKVTRTFDILERALKMFPLDKAIGGKKDGEWYAYSTEEYHRISHQLAMGLMSLGLKKGDKFATITNNRAEWNIADMALAMIGVIHVPIYPTISVEEYAFILDHSDTEYLLVGDAKLYEKLKPIIDKIPAIKESFTFEDASGLRHFNDIVKMGIENQDVFSSKLEALKDSIEPDDVATIIYTSGTTGVPKGVMLTQRNLVSNFTEHSKMHNLGYGHRAISFLPLCHVYERSVNYHFQYKGMTVYYVGNLGLIMSAIKEIKPHMFNSVPRLLERIHDGFLAKGKELSGISKKIYFWSIRLARHFEYYKKYSPLLSLKIKIADKLVYSKWREATGGNIQYIVSGGASLSPQITRVLGMAKICCLEGYGLTETSPVIAVSDPAKEEMKVGTVGPILKGYEVKFADDGEILCRGDGIMKGYYKAPEMTREVIDNDGWFHTGDIGLLEDGKYLKITDRKKEIFKLSGGKYVAPQPIENKLKTSDLIEQAMVIGENEKFVSALISPNFTLLHDWCSENKIFFRDNQALIQIPEVIKQIQREVAEVNKSLGQFEEIKRFRLVTEEWTPATGELSPTLKLKRSVIAEKYKDIIDEIYPVHKR